MAAHFLDTFAPTEGPIVCASGSCTAMIVHHYAELFPEDGDRRELSLAVASVFTPVSVHAQSLEEVVVTAQKREQNLQDVPITISAVSRELIEQRIKLFGGPVLLCRAAKESLEVSRCAHHCLEFSTTQSNQRSWLARDRLEAPSIIFKQRALTKILA